MAYSIELLSRDNAHLWEEFNNRSRDGTLFHSLRWKQVLEEMFHLEMRYYLIRDGPDVVGICPWVKQSALNFRGLGSIPHTETNNIVLDDTFEINRFNDVLSLFAKEYSFLRFNTYNPALFDQIRFAHVPHGETGHMMLNLKQTPPDAIWTNLSKKARYDVRIFENSGFEARLVERDSDLKEFYHNYVKNLIHIRGEILPLAFFEKLRDVFSPEELRIVIITKDDTFAGGSLAIADRARKKAYWEYLAINRDLPQRYTPTYCLIWDIINWAWENGYEQVSFGRQRADPANPRFRYKAKFGAEPIPIRSRMVMFSKPMLISYKIKKMLLESRNT